MRRSLSSLLNGVDHLTRINRCLVLVCIHQNEVPTSSLFVLRRLDFKAKLSALCFIVDWKFLLNFLQHVHISHVVFRIRLTLQLHRRKRLLQPRCHRRSGVEPVFQALAQLLVVWRLAEEALFVDMLLRRGYVQWLDALNGFHSAL